LKQLLNFLKKKVKTEIFVFRTNYVVLDGCFTLLYFTLLHMCTDSYDMIKLKCNASVLAISYTFPMKVTTKRGHIVFLD